MSARINKFQFDQDFDKFMSLSEKTRKICALQNEALRRIVTAPMSLDGGIAAKSIAEQCLIDSVHILNSEVEVNA